MNITVQRDILVSIYTVGIVSIDGLFFCYSLEDSMREELDAGGRYYWRRRMKVPGKTAIPAGRYEVVASHSARFGKLLPLLLNVPDFDGVRIHGGNTAEDTEGCILFGRVRDVSKGRVSDCAAVVADITNRIREAAFRGKVWLDVVNP